MYRQTVTGLSPEIVFWREDSSSLYRRDPNSTTKDCTESLEVFGPNRRKIGRRNPVSLISKLIYHQSVNLSPLKPYMLPIKKFDDFPSNVSEADFEIHENDRHNLLRPETIESLFYMFRLTGDEIYRQYAYNIFRSFMKYTKLNNGFSSIEDVMIKKGVVTFRDKMETFFLGETMKYFYLIFSDEAAEKVDLERYVFNTEAHPLPIFNPDEKLKDKLLFLKDD